MSGIFILKRDLSIRNMLLNRMKLETNKQEIEINRKSEKQLTKVVPMIILNDTNKDTSSSKNFSCTKTTGFSKATIDLDLRSPVSDAYSNVNKNHFGKSMNVRNFSDYKFGDTFNKTNVFNKNIKHSRYISELNNNTLTSTFSSFGLKKIIKRTNNSVVKFSDFNISPLQIELNNLQTIEQKQNKTQNFFKLTKLNSKPINHIFNDKIKKVKYIKDISNKNLPVFSNPVLKKNISTATGLLFSANLNNTASDNCYKNKRVSIRSVISGNKNTSFIPFSYYTKPQVGSLLFNNFQR